MEAKAKYARSLWQAACLTLPGIENQSLLDTMKSIGGFFKKYDCRFFAHQIPCDIDYQLCRPAPDSLMGVDYVIEYLRRICVENDLLRRFDPALTVRLLDLYCPDYKGLLINLYEPVAANALGLALTGGDIRKLEVSEGERERLRREAAGRGRKGMRVFRNTGRSGAGLYAVYGGRPVSPDTGGSAPWKSGGRFSRTFCLRGKDCKNK